jgi:hypothetical protein
LPACRTDTLALWDFFHILFFFLVATKKKKKKALLSRALVSAALKVKAPRKVSNPSSSACPPQFLFCPQEPLCFCSMGWEARGNRDQKPSWKSKEENVHFPRPP